MKLSPQADKMLTNRPYYWGFVERTGAPAETLSFNFVFDPEKYDERLAKARKPKPKRACLAYAGSAPGPLLRECSGSAHPRSRPHSAGEHWLRRQPAGPNLECFREEGKCVYLFQRRDTEPRPRARSTPYEQWLGVCFKVEFSCDLKREELFSRNLAIQPCDCPRLPGDPGWTRADAPLAGKRSRPPRALTLQRP